MIEIIANLIEEYRGIPNTNPPLIRSREGNLRKLIFALIEAGQNLARRRRKFLTFRRGDPLEIDKFWCLPEYKLRAFLLVGTDSPGFYFKSVKKEELAPKSTQECSDRSGNVRNGFRGKFYRGAILRFFLNFHFSSKILMFKPCRSKNLDCHWFSIGFPYCPVRKTNRKSMKTQVFRATRFEHHFFSMKNESWEKNRSIALM